MYLNKFFFVAFAAISMAAAIGERSSDSTFETTEINSEPIPNERRSPDDAIFGPPTVITIPSPKPPAGFKPKPKPKPKKLCIWLTECGKACPVGWYKKSENRCAMDTKRCCKVGAVKMECCHP
ncbi:Protein of unknown function [Pyronema omphalodes CBS 100304]|uniref:Uncharacterized protein n=1 Tax=Pyronema omphalodes (strain CBS 100304) TaxID=1076935 RepID=U4L6Y6_PYROM|nr:Protein of unknown function [Pyronema omphalodes CBS 100304]